jgi:ankyrin repeat protein
MLDHPSADPAAMMVLVNSEGSTALLFAAANGFVEAMYLLLDHPSADAAAMMAARRMDGNSALTAAAGFAAGQPTNRSRAPPRSTTTTASLHHHHHHHHHNARTHAPHLPAPA